MDFEGFWLILQGIAGENSATATATIRSKPFHFYIRIHRSFSTAICIVFGLFDFVVVIGTTILIWFCSMLLSPRPISLLISSWTHKATWNCTS